MIRITLLVAALALSSFGADAKLITEMVVTESGQPIAGVRVDHGGDAGTSLATDS